MLEFEKGLFVSVDKFRELQNSQETEQSYGGIVYSKFKNIENSPNDLCSGCPGKQLHPDKIGVKIGAKIHNCKTLRTIIGKLLISPNSR